MANNQPTYAIVILSVMGNLILTPVASSQLFMWFSAVLYVDQVFFVNEAFKALTRVSTMDAGSL